MLAPRYEIFDVRLVGINAETGRKLLVSIALVVIVLVVRRLLRWVIDRALRGPGPAHLRFWLRQAVALISALVLVVGLLSLWFDDPTRLATALGLVTAGLAFALQKVVTALAGYVVIMRGNTFRVGDRIVMGGVRGDVIGLDFTQTTIMEMGQPPPVQHADPAMWVQSRQYTGRVVTVSNARVFDEPVFNYTREFPYLWEELQVGIHYDDDRARVEALLLEVARRHTVDIEEISSEDRAELARRYFLRSPDLTPRVYYRMADDWLELTVRFVARDHGVRELKDAMCREILAGLDAAGIAVASRTIEVVNASRAG